MATSQFVCAINRNRDGYQLPLALHEAGLLARFVTDFYAPDDAPAWLPAPLRRRRVEGLPRAATHSSVPSFLVQSVAEVLRLPMASIFRRTDRMLGRAAGRIAQQTGSHLYCYAPYLPPDRLIPRNARRVIFEYHPLPGLSWEVLREDNARYPQTNWSFAQEARARDADSEFDVWRRSDAVSCASSVTKRSLIHAGCDPGRITVVPYGFHIAPAGPEGGSPPDPQAAEFLFVGQGVQRKGLHHLIEAWQRAEPPHARLTLVCYRIDPGIKAMIRMDSIRLLERQSREALEALYAGSHIFIMPSLLEGFGLVYLEALARGCHIVGTDNTGLPDLQLPDDAATILKAGDVDGLARAIARLAATASAGGFDRAAIRNAAQRWTWADFRAGIAEHARACLSG